MFKLYAVNNHKKSNVKGLWRDKGKVYKDNIHITKYKTKHALNTAISCLFLMNELSAFYTSKGKGYIISTKGKIDVLRHKKVYKRTKLHANEVKGIIRKYGGLTIYKKTSGYNIEVYYNYTIKGKNDKKQNTI